jgi:hypothetical protein
MPDVQSQMINFHEKIKLKRFEENEILREKRDRILNRLDQGLKKQFAQENLKVPKYETFDQGSYAMGTGVKPIDGQYDIDTGVRFQICKEDYPDTLIVKQWVYSALKNHTKSVEIRRPCVTVFYQQDGEPIYHVDLAIYSDKDCNFDGKMYIAKGKEDSDVKDRIWEESNPLALIELIKNHYPDRDDDKQFRRTIRYLKRWKDVQYSSDEDGAPIGIGLTAAAYYWFIPKKTISNFDSTRKYDDLEALKHFINAMLGNFRPIHLFGNIRLKVELPVSPHCDLFEKMTNNQMLLFRDRLSSLLDAIEEAKQKVDPADACKILHEQFGDDFPVPSRVNTAQKRSPAIVSTSASA